MAERACEAAPPKRPLIVFVQGSGFTHPWIYPEIPQLARYAQHGYVVAAVTHRSCLEGHPFPAYLQDVKTAIRFLRRHAEETASMPTGSGSGARLRAATRRSWPG